MFDPEKYRMIFCPNCSGNGKSPEDPEGLEVCRKCRGFGLIKKESQQPEKDKEQGDDKVQNDQNISIQV